MVEMDGGMTAVLLIIDILILMFGTDARTTAVLLVIGILILMFETDARTTAVLLVISTLPGVRNWQGNGCSSVVGNQHFNYLETLGMDGWTAATLFIISIVTLTGFMSWWQNDCCVVGNYFYQCDWLQTKTGEHVVAVYVAGCVLYRHQDNLPMSGHSDQRPFRSMWLCPFVVSGLVFLFIRVWHLSNAINSLCFQGFDFFRSTLE